MDNKKIDAISETMRELFEATQNTTLIDAHTRLLQGVNKIDWREQQLAAMGAYKRKLKDNLKVVEEDINHAIDRIPNIKVNKLKDINRRALAGLSVAMGDYMQRSIQRIYRLSKTQPLYDAILKQTQMGIDKAGPKIYANGRKVGYKEYMEMSTRTTVQNEIGEQTLDSGRDAKVIFYTTTVYGDSAGDHAPLQGKVYYDDRWESFGYNGDASDRIKQLIRSKKMMSIQEARGKPYWLSTRPNCRHNFVAITIEQAGLENPAKSLGIVRGSYKPDNYDKTQEQRKNERNIRFYKARLEQNERLYAVAPSEQLQRLITQDRANVRHWQGVQRELITKNPNILERDYRRETRNVILQDLGVKYNLT